MSSTIVKWLLAALVGLACRWLAGKVGGTCPLEPESFVCGHWQTIAGIAAAVLTALGYPVKRPGLAASKAPQRVEAPKAPKPPPAPEPEPATSGEIAIPTREPKELEQAAARDQDAGG